MSSVLKSFVFCACFGISSITVLGQGTACSADADSAKGSPIACVTGQGVEIKAAAATSEAQSSETLPLAPEQRPAARPVVIFQNGKLTINANNSTLSDILEIVGEKTGAVIDLPGAAEERVVAQLGPGQPRDVIASLLNGSHFNYVVVGNEVDANAVARIVLTAKSEHADAPNAPNGQPMITAANMARPMMQARNTFQQALEQAQQIQTPDVQQPPVASTSETPAPVNQASNGGESSTAPTGPTGTETAAIDPSSGDAQHASGDKTPQQMLQDLYETRRQMMQQQLQPKPQQPPQ
jgi:hypothetical protein